MQPPVLAWWNFLIIVPALLSGVVSASVALLLYLQRREKVFSRFAGFVLALTAYAAVDVSLALLVLSGQADTANPLFLGLGFTDFLLIGLMVRTLVAFAATLTDRMIRLPGTILSWMPAALALVMIPVVLAAPVWWDFDRLLLLGRAGLLVLFLVISGVGLDLLLRWKRIHDLVFRRILAGTGLLLLVFVPVWVLEVAGVIHALGVYFFLFGWNACALTIAARAWFRPPVAAPLDDLFSAVALDALARRFGLTAREREIAALHARGLSSREIGEQLSIAPKTVRNHISNVYAKTATGQRRELLALLRS